MKITVSKNDLEAALQVASIGISGSGNDLSTHFLFRETGDGIEVLSYSQRICTSAPLTCQYETETEGEAMTIEGWRLQKWLSVIGDVAVTLENTAKGEVTVASPRSKIRIKSLDANKFPFFDKTLGDAKEVATISSDRLVSALGYIKPFISENSNERPDVAQIEILDGVLWATDKKAVTMIKLDGLDESNLRIHGQDIPSVTKFLSNKDTGDVTLLEHDRSLFLKRADGALIGCSRHLVQFPDIPVPQGVDDQMSWEVHTEALLMGIHVLEAAGDKDNTRIGMAWENDQVQLKVKSAVGGEDSFPLDTVEHTELDDLPPEGFKMDYPYIEHIIGHFGNDSLKFGLNKLKSGGYVRFTHDVDDDSYVTVVAWR